MIRIFVGTEPKTHIMCQVLKHSILQHTKEPVEFTEMIGPQWEYPLDGIKVGTGFSLRRWMIPAACNWQGRAIYLDADMLVFADISELWSIPVSSASTTPVDTQVWLTYQPDKFRKTPWPQTSVMVIDCAAAHRLKNWGWRIQAVLDHLRASPTKVAYADFMHATWMYPERPGSIRETWNHLNKYVKGTTKLLHMTKEDEQPSYRPDLPMAPIWQQALVETIKAGMILRVDFEKALASWGVKEDWRHQNGLHPDYARFLKHF